ncbi:protein of unknown function [Pararobbsia alpina]
MRAWSSGKRRPVAFSAECMRPSVAQVRLAVCVMGSGVCLLDGRYLNARERELRGLIPS